MFVVTVTFEVEAAHSADFAAAVTTQAKNSLDLEPDCLRFDVCRDPDRDGRIVLYEIYRDAAAFDLHLASDHFKAFNALVEPWTRSKAVETWHLQAPAG